MGVVDERNAWCGRPCWKMKRFSCQAGGRLIDSGFGKRFRAGQSSGSVFRKCGCGCGRRASIFQEDFAGVVRVQFEGWVAGPPLQTNTAHSLSVNVELIVLPHAPALQLRVYLRMTSQPL